jgi:hypothetical protein
MKLKTLLIVVSFLAVLSAAAWWFNRPVPPPSLADSRVGAPLLDAASAEKAARVRLTENGKTVLLVRAGNAGWQVAGYHDLPADFAKLAALVKSLMTARVERLVTASPERIARLGFGETAITVLDEADKPLLELSLGKPADGSGRFIRFGSDKPAYLARLDTWLDMEPRNWADTALVRFNPADIAKITLSLPGGGAPLAFTRTDAKAAFTAGVTPEGKRLKAEALTSLLDTLAQLRFTETSPLEEPKAVAARAASRTVTLTTFGGKTLTFALGHEPERTVIKPDALKPDLALPAALVASAAKPSPLPSAAKAGPGSLAAGPLTEKIPAGPVFAVITDSDATSAVNAAMKKRAFQVGEFALNALPASTEALFELIPPPVAPAPAAK